MAVSDTNINETEKTSKEAQKTRDKKERPLTKVVVRRLPPGMDQESFLVQVSPVPDYDYIYMVKGDFSLGENAFSRVYLNFVNASDVFQFKEKFDNYVFVDQKGHEYPAVVEFASFQKIPRKRKPRPDPKCGSIELDPFYLEFLESLKEQPNQDEKPEFSYQFTDGKDELISTPLLDYIKQKRIDKQRIREERREERRRKELERKKLRDDERKRHEQKSPGKTIAKSTANARTSKVAALDSVKEEATEKVDGKVKTDDEKDDSLSEKNNSPSSTVVREHKYDDKKPFPKSKQRYTSRAEKEKQDFSERRTEYKRREDYREKEYRSRRFDDYKKEVDTKDMPRKAKKYSEKREERRNEAKKAEQKKIEEALGKTSKTDSSKVDEEDSKIKNEKAEVASKNDETKSEKVDEKKEKVDNKTDGSESHSHRHASDEENVQVVKHEQREREPKYKSKYDPRVQRRIRNKDRPTMQIYQPGMLSKRKTVDGTDTESSAVNKE